MIEEKEFNILIKSIKMLNAFSGKVESVNSGREYIIIHKRNIDTILKIAIERKSDYIKKKVLEYPEINAEEINDYIKSNKKEVNVLFFIFTFLYFFFIDRIIRMIKTRGSSPEIIKSKILKIEKLNGEILRVIENPYLEELY